MKVMKEAKLATRGRKPKYNWESIFDNLKGLAEGKMAVFSQGEDFLCSVSSYRVMIHAEAKKRGLLLDVWTLENGTDVGVRVSDRAPRRVNTDAKTKTPVKSAAKPSKRKTTRP